MRQKSSVRKNHSEAYRKARERAKFRSAAMTLAGQDIAPLPPVVDPMRRRAAEQDFRLFCETYGPRVFTLAWSADHLRVIAKIERVVRFGETLAVAMPRGDGKTSLSIFAVLWAILGGWHQFVYLIANTEEAALALLANIKAQLAGNELLLEDFPAAVYPIRRLEGESRRCIGQRYYGVPTEIGWGLDEVTMPIIPGSKCGESIIRVAGITGNIRGAMYVRADGTEVRPTLAVVDDPQTDASAASIIQTDSRMRIISRAIQGLAGPGKRTGIIIPCTVIRLGDLADRLLDRKKCPHWHGEKTKLVYSFPTNQRLWGEYAKILSESQRSDGDEGEATAFYGAHRATCGRPLNEQRPCATCPRQESCMDAGVVVGWAARFAEGELSAIQHAMNLRMRDPSAFAAEYQNEPFPTDGSDTELLTADQIAQRVNGRKPGHVPDSASQLTMFVDLHDKLLYWMVCAWEPNFTGYVIEYDTFPQQHRLFYSQRDAKVTLPHVYKGHGKEAAILAGLTDLLGKLLEKTWTRDDGTALQIGRCFIDSGYVPEMVYTAIRKINRIATVYPSKGVGIGPDGKPFAQYIRKIGEQYGYHWRIASTRGTRELPTVRIDTNFWKSFVQARLATHAGDPGSLTMFGEPANHELLAEHLASEYSVRTEGRGRTVDVWKLKPNALDNHWLDCLVGCASAATMLGVVLPGADTTGRRKPMGKRMRLSDLQRAG